MLIFFIQGLIIGIAISAPVGPVGMLCIKRSLENGVKTGLATGIGAATADNIYGLIAAFSLTAVSSFLISWQHPLRIAGGICLILFGLKLCIKKPDSHINDSSNMSLWKAYATGVILTITNPITFLSFMAIFTALGLGSSTMDYLEALSLVLGIMTGSTTWWVLLSGCIAFFLKHYINPTTITIINRISGSVMLLFGIYALNVIF